MSSDDDKNKSAAGFAGLSSLVSEVEIDADAPKSASVPPGSAKQEPPGEKQKSAPNAQQGGEPQPTTKTYQAPIQPSGNSGWKWVLGIGAVIAVIWMAGSGNKNQTSPSYSSSPSVPSYSPPAATPTAPSRLSEELPPVGTNNVLSGAQLRYCLAEDIRLESAKAAVNNYIDSHVDRFNGMVSDYNSRCGQFRYRKGALESARGEVERFRTELQSQGRERFLNAPKSNQVRPREAPARPAQRVAPLTSGSDSKAPHVSKQTKSATSAGQCTYSSECSGSNQCLDGRCRPARSAGERCVYSSECAGANQCLDGQCRPSRAGGERCTYSSECSGANQCLDGHCRPSRSSGERCTYSSECSGANQCLDGQCRPARSAGERCTYSSECMGMNECIQGKCQRSRY